MVESPIFIRPEKDAPIPAIARIAMDRTATWDIKTSTSLVSQDLAAGTLLHWGDVDGPEIAL